MSDSLSIPVVDLEDLSSGRQQHQERAAQAILEAFGTYGLIYIRNHDIDAEELDAFYDRFLEFTSRPESDKQTLSRGDLWYQRGWTPPNTERAVVAGGQPDFKECYFAAPEPFDPTLEAQYPQIFAQNIWPEGAEEFQSRYMDLGHRLHEVGMALLRGASRALGLAPYSFEELTHGGPHVTRALRYIPLNAEQVNQEILWGEEHTDFNLLTLLPGGRFFDPDGERCAKPDDACGLYLRTRPTAEHPRGLMVQGKAPAGCMVAQVGQQLEILTGGAFTATPHVIKAPGTPGYSRTACAHFIHVHSHKLLFPFEGFRTPETVAAYSPPVLAGTYGTKTLVDIGLAPKAALDSLGYRHYERLGNMRAEEDNG